MRLAVVADEESKAGWLAHGLREGTELVWLQKPATVPGAEAYIDTLFSSVANRLEEWEQIDGSPVIINDVLRSNDQLPSHFIRINGWPTFLQRGIAEAAGPQSLKEKATAIFAAFNRTTEWVPDIPGFLSARVVSMIINEAYYTLEEKVSTKEEIDTAMKLGTNYPYGPFDWAQRIGLLSVYQLLDKLSAVNSRYTPSDLLKKEALNK